MDPQPKLSNRPFRQRRIRSCVSSISRLNPFSQHNRHIRPKSAQARYSSSHRFRLILLHRPGQNRSARDSSKTVAWSRSGVAVDYEWREASERERATAVSRGGGEGECWGRNRRRGKSIGFVDEGVLAGAGRYGEDGWRGEGGGGENETALEEAEMRFGGELDHFEAVRA